MGNRIGYTIKGIRFPVFLSDGKRRLSLKKVKQSTFVGSPFWVRLRSKYRDLVGGRHDKVHSMDFAGFEVPGI